MIKKSITRAAAALHPKLILAPFDVLYAQFGFDAIMLIIDLFGGGVTVYLPSPRTIFSGCIEAAAKHDRLFRQAQVTELSKKYGFSDRHWRRKIRGT